MRPERWGLSRRGFLTGTIATACFAVPVATTAQPGSDGYRILRARRGSVSLRGAGRLSTGIWGYDGAVPGPMLRVRCGEEVKVRLVNELADPATIHWHGLRLPNAMDGVPHLTQPPVALSRGFDYRFVAPDAGTFWYHAHAPEQVERGLYGPLVVDEVSPVDVDRDVIMILNDWRLRADGSIDEESTLLTRDAVHGGRTGALLTVNSSDMFEIPAKTNERLRLRLINAATARLFALRIDRHAARVMAIDGQPAQPFLARDGRIALGPGNRVDLFVDVTLEPGASAAIIVDNDGREIALARIVCDRGGPARAEPLPDPAPLPANPLPERIDLLGSLKVDVPIEGTARPGSSNWAVAGFVSAAHGGPPLFTVKRGRAVTIAFANRATIPHVMHLHGHHFRLLDRLDDGWKPFWLDTCVIGPGETVRIAFVADNPGQWMIACRALERQAVGTAAWFEVT